MCVWGGQECRNQEFDFECIKSELSGEHPDGFFSIFMEYPQLSCSSRKLKGTLEIT